MTVLDFEGKILWKDTFEAELKTNTSSLLWSKALAEFDFNLNEVVLQIQFNEQSRNFYFVKPKDLKLKEAPINTRVLEQDYGYEITITSAVLQKDVFLSTETNGFFESNYIDILPKEKVVLKFITKDRVENLKIKTIALNTIR